MGSIVVKSNFMSIHVENHYYYCQNCENSPEFIIYIIRQTELIVGLLSFQRTLYVKASHARPARSGSPRIAPEG